MNKYIIIISIVSLLFFSCNNETSTSEINTDIVNNPITANNNKDRGSIPEFNFVSLSHDFGVIIEGEKVSYTYKFKNTGGSNLVISSASASCGCTVPKYTKAPIKPEQYGEVEVIFDSSGRNGIQHKTVTLMANTQPSQIELSFIAEIINPKN